MGLEDEVDDFLRKANVDSRAAAALRAEDAATQRAVLERGDMSDCRNPSASLMSRIRVAKENMMASRGRSISPRRRTSSPPPQPISSTPSTGGGPSQREIDDFIRDNDIDEMASRQLREADPATQRSVLDRGGLTDCRNASAVLLARIRDAKQVRAQPTFSQPPPQPTMMYGAYPGYGTPLYPAGTPAAFGAAYGTAGACGAYPGAYGAAYGMAPQVGYPPAAYGSAAAYGAYPGYPPVGAYGGGGAYGMPQAQGMATTSPMRYTPY